MGGRGRGVEIRPPEGFDRVYLPDEKFMLIAEALDGLGFKVDAYMNVDFDGALRKILDTCLLAEKDFDLGDVEATVIVRGCISEKEFSIDVGYKAKQADVGGSISIELVKYTSPDKLISKVKKVIRDIRDIVEEDIRERKREILEFRERRSKVENIMKELGYKIDTYGNYVKRVNGYEIVVIPKREYDFCSIAFGSIAIDHVAGVVRNVEEILAKLPPSQSEPKVGGDG